MGHTLTIDTRDGYFGDPAYADGAVKTFFFDDENNIEEGWYKKIVKTLNTGLPDKARDVWSVVWLPGVDVKKRQRQRQRKRKRNDDDESA